MDGICNCGAIKVHVEDDELFTKRRGHICHCTNCQKTSGSAWSVNLIIPASQVTLTGAENLSVYNDPKTGSGHPVKRYFCRTCGNPIKSKAKATDDAGMVILKLGIFGAEGKLPQPERETFIRSKHEWVGVTEGTKRWETVSGGKEADI